MKETIGLVGLGLVGTALAENLLAAGFAVAGYDLAAEKREHLCCLGGRAMDSAAEVAGAAARVVLSLPDTEVVVRVVEGAGGLLRAARLPTHVLDTTTGDPDATAALSARLAALGVAMLDATLSGSSDQVRRREAVLMVGGTTEALRECRDIAEAIAERVFHVGPAGSGSKAKLASNLILGLNRLALAEGLVFAERLGLDRAAFLEMVRSTPAYSCAMDVKGRKMVEGDFAPQSRIVQHHKDVRIILDYAGRAGQALPLTRVHFDILSAAIREGRGDLDTSAVILQLRGMGADLRAGRAGPREGQSQTSAPERE